MSALQENARSGWRRANSEEQRAIALEAALDEAGEVIHGELCAGERGGEYCRDACRKVDAALAASRAAVETTKRARDAAKPTYELLHQAEVVVSKDGLIAATDSEPVAIKCLRCGKTSHNAGDVSELYCGNCHVFHARA